MTRKRTLYIAGDSTAANKKIEKRPETGWGEKLPHYFTNQLTIRNCALNGRSTKSFIHEGHLEKIDQSIKKEDYLFIQFGHNDQKLDGVRGTCATGDYLAYLQQYISVAVSHQAYPVLLTSVSRRKYIATQKLDPLSVGDYPQAMIQFAKKMNVPLLDIFTRSQEFLNQFTQEETKRFFLHLAPNKSINYPNGVEDDTHFNNLGAEIIAKIVVEAISESDLLLKNYIIKENVSHDSFKFRYPSP